MRESEVASFQPWAIVLVLVAALLLAYPLSMGPMYWLCSDRSNQLIDLKGTIFSTVYYPLIAVYQTGPAPLKKPLQWYLGLWEK